MGAINETDKGLKVNVISYMMSYERIYFFAEPCIIFWFVSSIIEPGHQTPSQFSVPGFSVLGLDL